MAPRRTLCWKEQTMSHDPQPVRLFEPQACRFQFAPQAGAVPERWPLAAVTALLELPFMDLMFRAQTVHRESFDANAVQLSTPAVDQDRRLPGGLRLLPAGRTLPHTGVRESGPAAACGSGRVAATAAKAGGAHPLLHGRGVARSQSQGPGAGAGNGQRGKGPGPGNLRHPRHAARWPGRATQGPPGWTITTITWIRAPEFYGEIVSTRDYGDPPRHAGESPRRGHQRVLRRHRRHGRIARAQRAGLIAQLANLDPYPRIGAHQ